MCWLASAPDVGDLGAEDGTESGECEQDHAGGGHGPSPRFGRIQVVQVIVGEIVVGLVPEFVAQP